MDIANCHAILITTSYLTILVKFATTLVWTALAVVVQVAPHAIYRITPILPCKVNQKEKHANLTVMNFILSLINQQKIGFVPKLLQKHHSHPILNIGIAHTIAKPVLDLIIISAHPVAPTTIYWIVVV